MATQDQTISIQISGGLDSKSNSKNVLATRLTDLRNAIFDEVTIDQTKRLTVKKRPGYDALSKNISGGGSIGTAQAVAVYNDELLLFSNNKAYSYNESLDNWVDKGACFSFNHSVFQINRNAYQQSHIVHALNGNIYVSAWQDSRGGVRYTVKDFATGIEMASDQQISASGASPKLLSVGEYIFLFYNEAGVIKCHSWSYISSTSWSAALTVGSDLDASNPYIDVAQSSENIVIVYRTTTPTIAVKYIKQSLVIGSTTNGLVNPVFLTGNALSTIAVSVNQTTREVSIFWYNSTNGLQYRIVNADFTDKLTTTTIDATVTAEVRRIATYESSSGSFDVYYENLAGSSYNYLIKKNTCTNAGAVGSPSIFKRSVGLASRVFTSNGAVYMLVAYESTLQASYFVVDSSGNITNKIAYTLGGGILSNRSLPYVFSDGFKVYIPIQVKTKLISDNGLNYTLKGASYVEVDFNPNSNFYRRVLGGNLHISGGYLSIYDGQSVVEHGFHLYPENIALTPQTSSGSMADGTYLYYFTYEWIDNKGQIHRSKTSVGVSATVSGGGGSGRVQIVIPTLRLTAKASNRTNVYIGIYRTKAGQTTAFRVSSLSSPAFNDVTVDSLTIFDSGNDSAIGSNDLLYTTGGILSHGSSVASKLVTNHKNRLFLAGLENRSSFQFSKEYFDGESVNFADEFFLKNDDDGGDIIAAESMDDYYIIFKKNRIFVLQGNGPNDAGQQNDYKTPVRLSSDIGCIYQNSVVMTPVGIVFQSDKGIYLLSRQLQLDYIGKDVERYKNQEIMSADVVSKSNLIIFTVSDGLTLAYDYYAKDWSIYTNHNGIDAEIWKNKFVYLRNDGKVYVRNESKFLDDFQKYSLDITTGWIRVSSLQSFQRVKRLMAIGDYYSPHILYISVGYDFENFFSDSYSFNPDNVLATNIYGEGSPYGSEVVYGGVTDDVYQFEASLRRQKCQAVRFKFEDVFSGTAGQGFSLSELSLLIGIKKGLNKLKASKKV